MQALWPKMVLLAKSLELLPSILVDPGLVADRCILAITSRLLPSNLVFN